MTVYDSSGSSRSNISGLRRREQLGAPQGAARPKASARPSACSQPSLNPKAGKETVLAKVGQKLNWSAVVLLSKKVIRMAIPSSGNVVNVELSALWLVMR